MRARESISEGVEEERMRLVVALDRYANVRALNQKIKAVWRSKKHLNSSSLG